MITLCAIFLYFSASDTLSSVCLQYVIHHWLFQKLIKWFIIADKRKEIDTDALA
jgi:hypothetical protein